MPDDHDPAGGAAGVQIQADVADYVNYASWQNAVPCLRELKLCNPSTQAWEGLQLNVAATPAFIRPKQWRIDRLSPGDELVLRDRDLQLDPDYLLGLNEAERGLLRFSLVHNHQPIATARHDLRVLARDEWGGLAAGGELLAAFVMPNDPAVSKVLKTAAAVLAQHGHDSALNGYQTGDPRRAYLLTAALWSAIAAENLTYANPPSSFEQVGQKTRRPATILSAGLATCLDTTLLFAAAIEAVGLNPVVVLLQGHCFVGAWLIDKTLPELIETDCSELRKAIAGRELLTFETTLVTQRPPARFEDAVQSARSATVEANEPQFVAAIDIARARRAQIRPLASHQAATDPIPDEQECAAPLPLPKPPAFGDTAMDVADEKPTTPAGRVDRWQRKLLDLSLRNRLLNFKLNQQSVPCLCPDISRLEDRLAGGAKLRLISLPEQNPIGNRDAELYRQQSHRDLDEEFARQSLERDELACPLPVHELTNRLTTLYRAARNDLAEGGSNTLFLAVGFLRWKQQPDDDKSYRAPLLLLPAKLTRKSVLSPYRLSLHEDEVRFNATLIQLLKKDFDRDLSQFESQLPGDEQGVDVPRVLETMRREVRDIPGFEVINETAIGRFSFAKYLMWKDLVDRIAALENNRVVRHLIRNPDHPFDAGLGPIPKPREIDVKFTPQDICHPLPADSSQLSAVMAASAGHDFVLVGPPGTGKSQTIANLIAQCLSGGKTVLFVAEKTAALDVVHRRLREYGLSDCCVELHSNKAERRRFLDQLERAWQHNRRPSPHDWLTVSERLRIRRDELNAYVAAIHRTYANGWTPYEAMGVCVAGSQLTAPPLEWEPSVEHDRAAYQQLLETVQQLALTYQALDPAVRLPAVTAAAWSAHWEGELLQRCERLQDAARGLQSALQPYLRSLGLVHKHDGSLTELDQLNQLAQALGETAGENVQLLFHKQFRRFPAASRELAAAIKACQSARGSASAVYQTALDAVPLEELDRQWRQAAAAVWPLSWWRRRAVTRLLQTYADHGTADPTTDLAALRTLRDQLGAIANNALSGQSNHWAGEQTDVARLENQIRRAQQLRQALIKATQPWRATAVVSKAIYAALDGTAADHPLFRHAAAFTTQFAEFLNQLKQFRGTAGALPIDKQTAAVIQTAIDTAVSIQRHRASLQRWTSWSAIRQRAASWGLSGLIRELVSGRIAPADLSDRFRLAYARWWIKGVIDGDEILRRFQRFQHEAAIQDFQALDELARETAPARVRAGVAHDLPPPEGVARRSELGLLRHQMGLKRPSKSIREMIVGMPECFGKLAPCLLMSPLSIAQYLPASQTLFDVVVFDEASQITTWDAVGAIARGRQTIIVGDPKQLPPTNFFGRVDDDQANEELEDYERDLESILDEAKASGLPTLQLNWHYRSRHESLIAFSNWNYYQNRLITFPAAESIDRGVSFRHLPAARYDRGKSRTNRQEAEAIVAEAVARMQQQLQLPAEQRLTFGVVTFNSQQQSLIEDLFDQAQRESPELDWYFADERIEPTVVKNLENVQGDERDVMMFSITFGRDQSGRDIPLNFGAINREGGERRLNVAVTRARQELIVFSSFRADELNAERSQSRGVNDLKAFLEYAERGPEAILARIEGSLGGFESPLEEAVAAALQSRGWQVVTQVGVSGFRVDLGIRHPDRAGAYLAGVECDGATYHRSAAARDRDKTRQLVLENLGWNMLRVWSPDWWYDPSGASERLDTELQALLAQWRQCNAQPNPDADGTVPGNADDPALESDPLDADPAPHDPPQPDVLGTVSQIDLLRKRGRTPIVRSTLRAVPAIGVRPLFRDPSLASEVLPPADSAAEDATSEVSAPEDATSEVSAPEVSASEVSASEATAPDADGQASDAAPRVYYARVKLDDAIAHRDRFHDPDYDEPLRAMSEQLLQQEAPIRDDVLVQKIARAHGFGRSGAAIRNRVLQLLADVTATEEATGRFLWAGAQPQPVVPFRHPRSRGDRRSIDEISLAELRGLIAEQPELLTADDPAVAIARALGVARLSGAARQRLEAAMESDS